MTLISSLTSCVLGSLRYVLAFDFAILFVWSFVEIFLNVKDNPEYWLLAWFLLLPTAVVLVGAATWRWFRPAAFGVSAAANGSMNLLPMAVLDAALLLLAVLGADMFGWSFSTPLLLLCQTLLHKFTR